MMQGTPMPPSSPPAMPPSGGPSAGGMPPTGGGAIDPNNKLQALLLKRVDSLGPQDQEALMALTPPQAQAMKKVLPELAFLIDRMLLQGGGGQGEGGAPAAPMPPPGPQMRPGGRLNSVMA